MSATSEIVTLGRLADWLAADAAVQAILGTTSATAARARMAIMDDVLQTGAHLALMHGRLAVQRTPGGCYHGMLAIAVAILLPPPTDTALGVLTGLSKDLAALRRRLADFAPPRVQSVLSEAPMILDDSDGLPGWLAADVSCELMVEMP